MTRVFVTTDTEIWCGGWEGIDRKFPEAFQRYIHGPTAHGDRGLGFQLKVLNDHGLRGTFFVEPLFSLRFGPDPLAEIVGMILDAGQEVQLHLHTEWVDEARGEPLFPHIREKRQHLRYFSQNEQTRLIAEGKRLLEQAGAPPPVAFRAGSFAMNRDTLAALRANGIRFDSSYSAHAATPDSQIDSQRWLFQPLLVDGIHEYPLTFFSDGPNHFRHAQVTSCSRQELTGLLGHAAREQWPAVTILFHNFELLNAAKTHQNSIVTRRFLQLCRFLAQERKRLPTAVFAGLPELEQYAPQPAVYRSPRLRTGWRMVEQALGNAQNLLQAAQHRYLPIATSIATQPVPPSHRE